MVPATLHVTGVPELKGDAGAAKRLCRCVSSKQLGSPAEGPAGSPWACASTWGPATWASLSSPHTLRQWGLYARVPVVGVAQAGTRRAPGAGPSTHGSPPGEVVWRAAVVSQMPVFLALPGRSAPSDQTPKSPACKSELLVTMETAPGPSHRQHLLHELITQSTPSPPGSRE